MHDLNQIQALNQRVVDASNVTTARQQGKHVVAEYHGLNLAHIHTFGDKEQADHKVAQLSADYSSTGCRGVYHPPVR